MFYIKAKLTENVEVKVPLYNNRISAQYRFTLNTLNLTFLLTSLARVAILLAHRYFVRNVPKKKPPLGGRRQKAYQTLGKVHIIRHINLYIFL